MSAAKSKGSPHLQFRLLNFGGLSCSVCVALKKAKTLEKFASRHPEVLVTELLVNDTEGGHEAGTSFDDNYKLSDDYQVDSLPTLILETKDGGVLFKHEGGLSLSMLDKLYEQALTQLAAAKKIPW